MKNNVFFGVFIVSFPVLLFIFRNSDLAAQKSGTDSLPSFRLFEDDKLLEISLQFDLSTYFRAKPQKEYLKTRMTLIVNNDSISREIRLKTRGVFRNQYCMFAPIELNIKKANFGYSDLNRITKLKLVPQCNSGKDKEDYLLREYLAYRLFNVLTDTSFRVRLVKVNYYDTEKKKKPVEQFGFLLEPAEMLAARTNSLQIKTTTLNQKHIIPAIMDRLAIFNYMIGNYDWSVPGQHNVFITKSLIVDPYGLGIAIPHDFDWSGLVNPVYAVPAENVGTENVRQRLFMGVCRTREVYDRELEMFLQKKDQFYTVINECAYINQKEKKDMIDYLDGFFDQLSGNRNLILSTLLGTCKNF